MRQLNELQFDNTYARLSADFYSRVEPTAVPSPHLVSFNPKAAELIELDPREAGNPQLVAVLSGNLVPAGAEPLAAAYSGHQFGTFVPRLGDGRAILLGEVLTSSGERWDLQLKGAGQTPYSRGFDGRAVLRSVIREYLCSEAMHALGIPTTRALSIAGSPLPVFREQIETAAILLRMSPTHVRFGTFEFFHHRRQHERTKELADYVIARFFPEIDAGAPDKYQSLLRAATHRTARLIAGWQAVGFAHGVMNTDNMSILGLTLDYGPYGFMEEFDSGFICNHSDHGGRYAFDRQPGIGLWNLSCLAQALIPHITREEALAVLDEYQGVFSEAYAALMRAKLGLREGRAGDAALLFGLMQILQKNGVDYTSFFRALSDFDASPQAKNDPLRDKFIDPQDFDRWAAEYRARLEDEGSISEERREGMRRVNPIYILRNHLAQEAIRRATEAADYSELERLLELLQAPYTERAGMESYTLPPPAGTKRVAVSCSS